MAERPQPDFQRARRPEQQELRRRAILDATEALLAEVSVEELTLRELGRALGTSKTNIVRYFESREGVLMALLNRQMQVWLDDLPAELPDGPAEPGPLMRALARSVAARPLLCQLFSQLPGVLERNISAESVRANQLANLELRTRLASLLGARLPRLSPAEALHLTDLAVITLTGLWPYCNPTPAVIEATSDPRLAGSRLDFVTTYAEMLQLTAIGLLSRADSPS